MMSIGQDLRYGVRVLYKDPGFTVVALLTLALGIGANTAIFAVLNAVTLRPLRFKEPERLVRLYSQFQGADMSRFWLSAPEYLDIRGNTKSWEAMGAYFVAGNGNLSGIAEPIQVNALFATSDLFITLGVQPMLGRLLAPEDEFRDGIGDILISYGLWQRAFGGDHQIVGRTFGLDGVKVTIVGVMPAEFKFPLSDTEAIDVWLPLRINAANPGERTRHRLSVIGRLRPGVSLTQARAEMDQLLQIWTDAPTASHSFHKKEHPVVMYSLHEEVVGNVRSVLFTLLGAVSFVLLIACINIATLQLSRVESRQKEIAVRSAIGATQSRLLNQFLAEGILLSFIGGLLGVIGAKWGVSILIAANPQAFPRTEEVGIDIWVLLFTSGISIITSLLFAVAPLIHVRKLDLYRALKLAGRAAAFGRNRYLFRRALVVAEVAFASILLIGSGLMIRSFRRLQQIDIGFDHKGLLMMQIRLPRRTFQNNNSVIEFWSQVQQQLGGLPGLISTTLTSGLPPVRSL
ncbi:MAG: ABC transporter permease, partial [Nitrososphaerales archaeon]